MLEAADAVTADQSIAGTVHPEPKCYPKVKNMISKHLDPEIKDKHTAHSERPRDTRALPYLLTSKGDETRRLSQLGCEKDTLPRRNLKPFARRFADIKMPNGWNVQAVSPSSRTFPRFQSHMLKESDWKARRASMVQIQKMCEKGRHCDYWYPPTCIFHEE